MFEKLPDYLIREDVAGSTAARMAEEEGAAAAWRFAVEPAGSEAGERPGAKLSRYECDNCGDRHYHTKWQLGLRDQPGYEFPDPCPPSMREVQNTVDLMCTCPIIAHSYCALLPPCHIITVKLKRNNPAAEDLRPV